MINNDFVELRSRGLNKEDLYKEMLVRGYKIDEIAELFLDSSARNSLRTPAPIPRGDFHPKVIQYFVIIGVLLIAVGAFAFVASNWEEMPNFLKVGVIVCGMLTAYSIGWFLTYVKSYRRSGIALMLLGSLLYGAGIFLIAQMYHIQAHWPDGFLLWLVGVAPFLWFERSFIFHILCAILAMVGAVSSFSIFASNSITPETTMLLVLFSIGICFYMGWRIVGEEYKKYEIY